MKRKTLETWVTLLLITEAGCACRASRAWAPPPRDKRRHLKNTPHLEELSLAGCRTVWHCLWDAAWQLSPTSIPDWQLLLPHVPFLSASPKHFTQQLVPHWCASSKNPASLIIWECLKGMQSSRTHKLFMPHTHVHSAELTEMKRTDSHISLPVFVILQFSNDLIINPFYQGSITFPAHNSESLQFLNFLWLSE